MGDEPRLAATALPSGAALAFMELMAAVVLDPWGTAGRSSGDPNMPNVPFGPGGRGMVSYLIVQDERRVWVTRVTWAG